MIDRGQIQELMNQANGLDYGPTQIGLLEEAVRLADLLMDVPLGYDARTRLIKAANFAGSPEKSMVAFSWCLAQLDREPDRYNLHEILWQYKWVIGDLTSFPQVTRAQITAAMADLGRRVEQAGYGMKPVYKLQFAAANKMGDEAEHHAAHARWIKAPRSTLSDCAACDLNADVDYLINSGKLEEAMDRARPIFAGTSRCTVVPQVTLARALIPLIKLGRVDEAVSCHLKGYRGIAKNRYFLHSISAHVEFLALTDNLAKGIKLFEAHLPWALDTFDLYDRFKFSIRSKFLFDRLLTSGKSTIKLRLPESFPIHESAGKYEVAKVIAWLDRDARDLAGRFDARNGNDRMIREVEDHGKIEEWLTPCSLKPRAKDKASPKAADPGEIPSDD